MIARRIQSPDLPLPWSGRCGEVIRITTAAVTRPSGPDSSVDRAQPAVKRIAPEGAWSPPTAVAVLTLTAQRNTAHKSKARTGK